MELAEVAGVEKPHAQAVRRVARHAKRAKMVNQIGSRQRRRVAAVLLLRREQVRVPHPLLAPRRRPRELEERLHMIFVQLRRAAVAVEHLAVERIRENNVRDLPERLRVLQDAPDSGVTAAERREADAAELHVPALAAYRPRGLLQERLKPGRFFELGVVGLQADADERRVSPGLVEVLLRAPRRAVKEHDQINGLPGADFQIVRHEKLPDGELLPAAGHVNSLRRDRALGGGERKAHGGDQQRSEPAAGRYHN